MLRLLRFIFTGSWHEHKWDIYSDVDYINDHGNHTRRKIILKCTECGQIKEKVFW